MRGKKEMGGKKRRGKNEDIQMEEKNIGKGTNRWK
jgi:hypothetical protein